MTQQALDRIKELAQSVDPQAKQAIRNFLQAIAAAVRGAGDNRQKLAEVTQEIENAVVHPALADDPQQGQQTGQQSSSGRSGTQSGSGGASTTQQPSPGDDADDKTRTDRQHERDEQSKRGQPQGQKPRR